MIESAHSDDHPEELITLALAGTLDDAKWRELSLHLAGCRPCSTQLRLSGWMDQESASNAALSQLRDRMVVLRALESWDQVQRSRRFPMVPRWAPAATVALVLSGVAAAMVLPWKTRSPAPPREQRLASRTPLPELETLAPPSSEAASVSTASTASTVESAKPTGSEASPAKKIAAKPAEPGPSALFARASELRLKGQSQAAVATFERLQKLYPHSRESEISHLVVGRVWLESQRPDLAAPEFARYLESGKAANEEALVGHATALRRLGKLTEEAADWQHLLTQFPHSLYAAGAIRRLAELRRTKPTGASRNSSPQ